MPRSRGLVWLLAVALGSAGCTAPRPTPPTAAAAPVEAQADAVAIAQAAVQASPEAARSFRVEAHPDVWVVWDGPTPEQTHHIVIINRRTGKTSVGSYQVATIDEKL